MPSDPLDLDRIRIALRDPESLKKDGFAILRALCIAVSTQPDNSAVQELVLRALNVADYFGSDQVILDGIVRQIGLFPYLDRDELSFADQIAYELHRPDNLGEEVVFHRPQAEVYWTLLDGKNVVLSAPTSFGKSLIIDALIASGRYYNILLIVPTIALIDETRRRLMRRFRGDYKILTHPHQKLGERNIIVVTQERVSDAFDLDAVDLFVVDEFYKLNFGDDDLERTVRLNHVVYEVTKRGKQFYMLGPNVAGTSENFSRRIRYEQFIEPYRTVVSELHEVPAGESDMARLIALCRTLHEPTIIFCSSPGRAMDVTKELIGAGLGTQSQECQELAQWVAVHYHPDWHFTKALELGLGVHHGRIPRALAQYVVHLFNAGEINFLTCTSTLIEGVNTRAKNIIIFDNKINRRSLDLFTFNNIRGRSGRMGQHFIGHVYLFHPPPADELPEVDPPVYSQPSNAPDSLLIQVDERDLSEESEERLRRYLIQEILDYATLKASVGLDPERQLEVAREILSDLEKWRPLLQWTSLPSNRQVREICDLLWRHFDGSRLGAGSVRSASQLTLLINRLRRAPSALDLINQRINFDGGTDVDASVQNVLDFLKLWAGFHFPRLLRGLDNIQQDLFERLGEQPGHYEHFILSVESYFLPPEVFALDEYGVPLELARKLRAELASSGDLDLTLEKLRTLPVNQLNLTVAPH